MRRQNPANDETQVKNLKGHEYKRKAEGVLVVVDGELVLLVEELEYLDQEEPGELPQLGVDLAEKGKGVLGVERGVAPPVLLDAKTR